MKKYLIVLAILWYISAESRASVILSEDFEHYASTTELQAAYGQAASLIQLSSTSTPPISQTSGSKVLSIGNACSSRLLGRTLDTDWTIRFQIWANTTNHVQSIGLFSRDGTSGYVAVYNTGASGQFITIGKYTGIGLPTVWNYPITKVSGNSSISVQAGGSSFLTLSLSWNASTHKLTLTGGDTTLTWTDPAPIPSFSTLLIQGNGKTEFDNISIEGYDPVYSDTFENYSDSTALRQIFSGTPNLVTLSPSTIPPSSLSTGTQVISLGNNCTSTSLARTITSDWTLNLEVWANGTNHVQTIGLFSSDGTAGYIIDYNTGSSGQFVAIGKYTGNTLPVVWNYPFTKVSGNSSVSVQAGGNTFLPLALHWNSATHTLTLNSGTNTLQWTDPSPIASFSTLLLQGNGTTEFNNISITVPDVSLWSTLSDPTGLPTDLNQCVSILDYGAQQNSDCTSAINQAISAAQTKAKCVYVPPGKYYYTSFTLNGAKLIGAGDSSILYGTDPNNHTITLTGTHTGVFNLKLYSPSTTRTGGKDAIAIRPPSQNFYVEGNTIDGSAAAGIINYGGSNGRITANRVCNTLADAIHNTNGSSNVYIAGNYVRNSGDDCIAVVSYQNQSALTRDILIENNDCANQVITGRGYSVVGGDSITIQNNRIVNSVGAGIYLASEGSYSTSGVNNVVVTDNVLDHCPSALPGFGQTSIFAYTGTPYMVKNIDVSSNIITNALNGPISIKGTDTSINVSTAGNSFLSLSLSWNSTTHTLTLSGGENVLNWTDTEPISAFSTLFLQGNGVTEFDNITISSANVAFSETFEEYANTTALRTVYTSTPTLATLSSITTPPCSVSSGTKVISLGNTCTSSTLGTVLSSDWTLNFQVWANGPNHTQTIGLFSNDGTSGYLACYRTDASRPYVAIGKYSGSGLPTAWNYAFTKLAANTENIYCSNNTYNSTPIAAVPNANGSGVGITGAKIDASILGGQSVGFPMFWEVEYLSIPNFRSLSGGTTRLLPIDPLMSNGCGVQLDSNSVADYITFCLPNIPAGTYNIKVGVRQSPDLGKFQLQIGRADDFLGTAVTVGVVQDQYSANYSYGEIDLGNWTVGTSESDEWFRFNVIDKNPASQGSTYNYSLCFDYIKLVPL